MSITIIFEPVDTLFFRGNRPFSAGADTFAESIYPSPLTVYGAIGDYILKKNNTNLMDFFNSSIVDTILGKYDADLKDTRVTIKGPFLFLNDKIYFSPPANIHIENGWNIHICLPDTSRKDRWDIKDELYPISLPDKETKPYNKLLPADNMIRYLSNDKIHSFIGEVDTEEIVKNERRYGHKLKAATLTVKEGFLYSIDHARYKDELSSKVYNKAGLAVFVEGLNKKEYPDGVTVIGGEKRMSCIFFKEDLKIPTADLSDKFNGSFFIYLATPAIFSDGFKKDNWFDGFNAQLVGAALNKPLYISGWKRIDFSKGNPRPLRRAVPAGSVYFFKVDKWNKAKFNDFYNQHNFNKSLSDEYQSAGFGVGLIGIWQ